MSLTSTQNAPTAELVTPHFILGGISFLIVAFILAVNPEMVMGHFFNAKLLATTHLLVLGFVTMICIGALYQLIPVILEVKLFSEKLGWLTLVTFSSGIAFLVYAFWNLNFSLIFHIAAGLIFVGISIFKVNILLTVTNKTQNTIEKKFILTAIGWLFVTVIAGIIFGINLSTSFLSISHIELLKLHAHIGIFGWFIQLIMGVGSKLFPMFLLSYEVNKNLLKTAYYSINLGLLIAIMSLLFTNNNSFMLALILVLIALVIFLRFIFQTYRKRAKKNLDIAMKKSILAVSFIAIPFFIFMTVLVSSDSEFTINLSVLYGFSLLIGVISMLILGLTYKTLPFIIWLKEYKNIIGKQKTPLPKDLYSAKIQSGQLISFILGFWIIIVGVFLFKILIVQIGAFLLLIASLLYSSNILKIVTHKAKIL